MSRITGQWWEGEANSAQEACGQAGWIIGDCWVRQYYPKRGWKKPEKAEEKPKAQAKPQVQPAQASQSEKGEEK